MAQCQAEGKKQTSGGFDLYGGIFKGQLYDSYDKQRSSDRSQSARYNVDSYVSRRSRKDDFNHETVRREDFGAGGCKGESGGEINNLVGSSYTCNSAQRNSSACSHARADPTSFRSDGKFRSGGSKYVQYSKSTTSFAGSSSGHGTAKAGFCVGENEPQGTLGKSTFQEDISNVNKHGCERSFRQVTPSTQAKFEGLSSLKLGEPITGVVNPPNLGDVVVGGRLEAASGSTSGLSSTGSCSGGSTKGRSPRSMSPKSCASSGGSSSGGSPTVGRSSNVGNILPNARAFTVGVTPAAIKNVVYSTSKAGSSKDNVVLINDAPHPRSAISCESLKEASFSGVSASVQSSHSGNVKGFAASKIGNEKNVLRSIYTGENLGANSKGSVSNGGGDRSTVVSTPVDTRSSRILNTGGLTYGSSSTGTIRGENTKGAITDFGNIAAVSENLLIKKALSSVDAEDVKNAGNDLYKKGHFSEALCLYDRAVYLAPERAPYRSNRAAALTGLGRLDEAVQECIHAIRIDPSYARAHHRLASLYLRLGQVEHAKRHFKAAGSQTGWADSQRLLQVEKSIGRCNDSKKASDWHALIRESDAALLAGADSASEVIAFKAEALMMLHGPEAANAYLVDVQKVGDPLKQRYSLTTDKFVLTIQALINMALGRFDAAVLIAEKAAQCGQCDLEVAALVKKCRAVAAARKNGNELYNAGKFNAALRAYGDGLQLSRDNPVLLCNRAACRSKLGHWEKAVEDCNAALEAQPNYVKALMRRAQSFAKLERWEDAIRDYEVLRKEVPDDFEVARALFDSQVNLKKSRGEETYKLRFGGEVEKLCSNNDFQQAITYPGLAVVQFNTMWSESCKQMSPFLDELCKRYPSVNFLKVDVDEIPNLARLESVSFVPTFKMYKNGLKVKEFRGPSPQILEHAVNHYSF